MIDITKRCAVFTDIDGTLVNGVHASISPRVVAVLKKLREMGHAVFINSGRGGGFIPSEYLNCGGFDGMVAGMGAYILYHGEVIYNDHIPNALADEVVQYCLDHGENCILEGPPGSRYRRVTFGDPGVFKGETDVCYPSVEAFRKDAPDFEATKITTPVPPSPDYLAYLRRYFDMVVVGDIYSEGAMHGNDKGHGILVACEKLGIDPKNTVAIGDSENDLGMLRTAGYSVVMGSAPDEVKALADLVTGTVAEDGVAVALEKIFAL